MARNRDGHATAAPDQLVVRCMDCGQERAGDQAITACPACGGLLDVVVPLDRVLTPDEFRVPRGVPGLTSGVWRYRALLPPFLDDVIVTRHEGNTPLYWDDRLTAYAALSGGRFGVKHEGQNPTGSFKDRGMTVALTHAKAVGATIVACASTGNTSASLASYAAAAAIPAIVLIPEGKISASKLGQTVALGARVVQIEGDFDDALAILRELAMTHNVYLANSVNPFRPEGQKTIVFELLEQLAWQPPDIIALPGGNLGNTAAFGKALTEAYAVGLINRLPRLVTVQAAGAAPFAAYYDTGFDHYAPVHAETIASAIKIGNPASVERARRSIQTTNGIVTAVSDDELLDAKAVIDAAGIGAEPASAASLAGIRKLVREGEVAPDATVVGVLTGNILKDTEAIARYHLGDEQGTRSNRPVRIPAEMAALEKVLDDALHG